MTLTTLTRRRTTEHNDTILYKKERPREIIAPARAPLHRHCTDIQKDWKPRQGSASLLLYVALIPRITRAAWPPSRPRSPTAPHYIRSHTTHTYTARISWILIFLWNASVRSTPRSPDRSPRNIAPLIAIRGVGVRRCTVGNATVRALHRFRAYSLYVPHILHTWHLYRARWYRTKHMPSWARCTFRLIV